VSQFDDLKAAKRFCAAINELTDWSRPLPELQADPELGRAMHRLALDITGVRPDLRVV
jgi:hypothetical protein